MLGSLPEQVRCPEQRRDMHVVSARVHHGDIVAVTVDSANCTGVRKTGRLGHGQRVHVCAEQDGRALPVAQYPDHTGATDAFVHLVSAITKRSVTFLAVRCS